MLYFFLDLVYVVSALIDASEAYRQLADIKYQMEDNVKHNFLDPLAHLQQTDLKEVNVWMLRCPSQEIFYFSDKLILGIISSFHRFCIIASQNEAEGATPGLRLQKTETNTRYLEHFIWLKKSSWKKNHVFFIQLTLAA